MLAGEGEGGGSSAAGFGFGGLSQKDGDGLQLGLSEDALASSSGARIGRVQRGGWRGGLIAARGKGQGDCFDVDGRQWGKGLRRDLGAQLFARNPRLGFVGVAGGAERHAMVQLAIAARRALVQSGVGG